MKRVITILSICLFITNMKAQQQKGEYLSAKDSDPIKMGWMQGFPPAKDKALSALDGSFFEFPALRWSVVHMRQFLPTTITSKSFDSPHQFKYKLDKNIDTIEFLPWDTNKKMTWEESLWENYTDGIIVLHKGDVVYERYFGALTESEVHAVMSLTKSFTGTLASILAAEGKIDPDKLVSFYVPELKKSAFGDATVRQVMDMTTALKYSEDYADPNAEIWAFSAAGNPFPQADGQKPIGYYEYLKNVKKEGNHGEAFGYKTVNADVLGWVIAKASGKSVDQLLSEKIWSKIGMEQDAYYQVDALGTPFAGGGLSAGLRDLARFGQLVLNMGNWQGKQIIPMSAISDIMKGGNKEAFAKSEYTKLEGWSYRDMWWITENSNGAFAARGVHGQTIYIDPKAEMIIVRLASHPVAANGANDPYSLPAYQAIADYLINK